MPLSQAELTIAIVYCMVPRYIKLTNCNVFNTCARLICNESKYCHLTPLLMELHQLPIELRIEFKIILIVFKIFKGLAPSYLSSLITRKPESRYNLRNSSDKTLLSYPSFKSKATIGDRAFIFAAPKLWNNLPREIRESSYISYLL